MADLKVMNKDNPVYVNSNNKLKLDFLTGIPAVRQSIKTRLQTFKTEFFLNVDFGIDWYGTVLNSGMQPIEQESELNEMVIGTNGVDSMQASELLRSTQTKELIYLSEVVSDGQIIQTQLPFDFLEA